MFVISYNKLPGDKVLVNQKYISKIRKGQPLHVVPSEVVVGSRTPVGKPLAQGSDSSISYRASRWDKKLTRRRAS